MTRISRLAYQIVADTENFSRGMRLTREELALQNQVFRDSIDPLQAHAAEVTALEQLLAKKAISEQQYTASMQRLAAAHPEAIAAAQQQAEAERLAQQQAEQLQASIDSVTGRLQEQIATAGMTADQIEVYRLAQQGATEEQLAAVQSLQQQAAAVRGTGQAYVETATELRNAAAAVTAFVGATTGGIAILGREMVAAYQVQEAAETRLTALMQARGTYTDAAIDQYRRFATQIQQTTIYGDEMVLGLIQQTEALGLSGDSAERAARNAIALSAALGMSAESAIRMTANLERGDTSMLTRYMSTLKSIEDPTLRAAEAQRMLANMFAAANAEAETTSGQIQQMRNAVGDAYEAVGEFVAGAIVPLANGVQYVAESFTALPDPLQATVAYAGLAVVGLGAVATAGAAAVTVGGQIVISYGAVSKALAAVSVNSRLAAVGMSTMKGAGFATAAVAAAVGGYQLGQSLFDVSEKGMVATRVYRDFAAATQSVSNVEFAGQAREDIEAYIAATERSIERIQSHNEELENSKAWWNFWQANRDLVNANSAQVDALRENLNKAKFELSGQDTAVNPLVMDTAAADALDQVTAKLQEQIALTGMSADEAERWKLAQAGVNETQLASVAIMQQQAVAAQAAVDLDRDLNQVLDDLSQQIQTAGLSADQIQIAELRARGLGEAWLSTIEKMQAAANAARQAAEVAADVDKLRDSLSEQIATAGMSAEAAERWRLAQRGASAETLASVDALQQQAAAASRTADVAASVDQLTAAYREQIATAAMSREEAELWRLAQDGATAEQLSQVAALQRQAAAARDMAKAKEEARRSDEALTAAQRGSREALERIDAYRRLAAEVEPARPATPEQSPIVQQLILAAPTAADAARQEIASTLANLPPIALPPIDVPDISAEITDQLAALQPPEIFVPVQLVLSELPDLGTFLQPTIMAPAAVASQAPPPAAPVAAAPQVPTLVPVARTAVQQPASPGDFPSESADSMATARIEALLNRIAAAAEAAAREPGVIVEEVRL